MGFLTKMKIPTNESPAKWEHGYNGTEHTKNMGLQGIPANFLLDIYHSNLTRVHRGYRVEMSNFAKFCRHIDYTKISLLFGRSLVQDKQY